MLAVGSEVQSMVHRGKGQGWREGWKELGEEWREGGRKGGMPQETGTSSVFSEYTLSGILPPPKNKNIQQ